MGKGVLKLQDKQVGLIETIRQIYPNHVIIQLLKCNEKLSKPQRGAPYLHLIKKPTGPTSNSHSYFAKTLQCRNIPRDRVHSPLLKSRDG